MHASIASIALALACAGAALAQSVTIYVRSLRSEHTDERSKSFRPGQRQLSPPSLRASVSSDRPTAQSRTRRPSPRPVSRRRRRSARARRRTRARRSAASARSVSPVRLPARARADSLVPVTVVESCSYQTAPATGSCVASVSGGAFGVSSSTQISYSGSVTSTVILASAAPTSATTSSAGSLKSSQLGSAPTTYGPALALALAAGVGMAAVLL